MNDPTENLNLTDIHPADRRAYLAWVAAEGVANEAEQSEIRALTTSDPTFAALIIAEQSFTRRLNFAAEMPLADSLADLAAETVARQQRLRWLWRGAVATASAMAACVAVAFLLRTATPISPNTSKGILNVTGPLAEAALGAPVLDFAISAPADKLVAARASHTIHAVPLLICTASIPVQPINGTD